MIQEQRKILDKNELIAYLIEQYNNFKKYIAEDRYVWCRGKDIEEVMYEYALPRHKIYSLLKLGTIKTFSSGDFKYFYQFLALCVRYYYACDIHAEILRGEGYAKGTGIDHSTYRDMVEACFALMRPDWAKRFFPEELGMITRSHPTIKRTHNLVIGLLHDKAEWKEQAYRDGRKFLDGKRIVSDRAIVSYLCNLYDSNINGMSDDLEILMNVYHKTPWLMLPGGHSTAITLFGYYLMGRLYLSERDFANLRRPSGPGWWDEYIDICLQNPIPPELSEPPVIFPEPLGFLNTAVRWIEQGPPPGTFLLSLDIKRAKDASCSEQR